MMQLFKKQSRRKKIERTIGIPFKYDETSIFRKYHYNRMKKRALNAWKMTGKQHHVLRVDPQNCIIINNVLRKQYNKTAKHPMNVNQLLQLAMFSTPAGTNSFR